MLGSNVLDVAIGLCFVFLLLSLICSAANELFEMMMKNRAADLEKGIAELIGNPQNTKQFLADIYNHGLVNSLYEGDYATSKERPSYIPSENFALAILAVREKWTAAGAAGATVPLPENVKTAFAAFEKTSGGDINKLQVSVEKWYDSAMDRVSGWYKRRTQKIIFAVGFAVTIAINADCINIAQRLSSDASLRQGVVALAEATAKTPPVADGKDTSVKSIEGNIQSLNSLGLPLGWDGKLDLSASTWPERLLGWLVTALAISLGAPFWFDMLNKLIVVRSTVKPHEKSQEESSKDSVSANAAAA